MSLLVFADTNALVAMHCFPPEGGKTLSSEVAEAIEAGECRLLICDAVAAELREVVARDFPRALSGLEAFLERFGVVDLPVPGRVRLEAARAVCVDVDDAPILVAALQSAELFGAMLLLSNDFETFHTSEVKALLREGGMVPVSLFGLLRLLGRR